MTTCVKVDVNGRYRATIIQTTADGKKLDPVVVEGRYDGSPNPSGQYTFWLHHPAESTFEIKEEYIGDPKPAEPTVPEAEQTRE